MANLAYSKLKLKTQSEITEVEVGEGLIVEVNSYLPAEKKAQFVNVAIEDCSVGGVVRKDLLNPLFNFLLVKNYTNITFTEKQMSDPLKLYDELATNGVLDLLVEAIPESEIHVLTELVEAYGEEMSKIGVASVTGFGASKATGDATQEFMNTLAKQGHFDEIIKDVFKLDDK